MARYFYCSMPQKHTLSDENVEYTSYGISVLKIHGHSATPIYIVSDVSLDRDLVFTLAYWCTFKQLSPLHLLDVILDTLD